MRCSSGKRSARFDGFAAAFDSDHPPFKAALQKILASAKARGIAAGIHVSDAAQARRRILEGWQFIAVLSESRPDAGQAGEIAKELGLGKARPWPGY